MLVYVLSICHLSTHVLATAKPKCTAQGPGHSRNAEDVVAIWMFRSVFCDSWLLHCPMSSRSGKEWV